MDASESSTAGARPAWRWAIFAASAPLFASSQLYRVTNAVLAADLQRDLGLGSEALGRLSAAFFYAFAAAQVLLALTLDRLGARRILLALNLVGAAGALVFATARGGGQALVGEALLGAGMAGNLMGPMLLLGRWFPAWQYATVAGLLGSLGTVGNALAATPLALVAGAVGWRATLGGLSAATALIAVTFYAVVRERPPGAAAAPAREGAQELRAAARTLLASRDYWLISVGMFSRYGAYAAIRGLWAGPFLREMAGASAVQAANGVLLLDATFIAGSTLGGWLSDRVLRSRKAPMLVALAGMAASVAILALAGPRPGAGLLVAALALLGGTAAFGSVSYLHIRDLMPARMAGMALAGVNFFVMLGAGAFLHATGAILEQMAGPGGARTPAGYRAAFLAVAGVTAAALVLYAFTRDARVKGAGEAQVGAQRGRA